MAVAHSLIEPQDLHCPRCEYDLTGAVQAMAKAASHSFDVPPTQPLEGDIRCPECGLVVPLAHLRGLNNPNRNGEPQSLSPHETVVSGRLFVIALIAAAALLAIMLNLLL